MYHRKVIVAGVVILLLAVGGFAAAQVEPDGAAGVPENRTITVQATGTAAAPPDRALVRVAVIETAPAADAARQRVAATAAELRETLRAHGIGDDRVRTTYVHLGPTDPPDDGGADGRYRAAHGFEIDVPIDRAGSVVDIAVANGANRVDGVAFTLTDATERRLRATALDRAMDDARTDAETIANASDVRVAGIQSATTRQVETVAAEADRGGARTGERASALEPGPVRVTASVSVTYRVET